MDAMSVTKTVNQRIYSNNFTLSHKDSCCRPPTASPNYWGEGGWPAAEQLLFFLCVFQVSRGKHEASAELESRTTWGHVNFFFLTCVLCSPRACLRSPEKRNNNNSKACSAG